MTPTVTPTTMNTTRAAASRPPRRVGAQTQIEHHAISQTGVAGGAAVTDDHFAVSVGGHARLVGRQDNGGVQPPGSVGEQIHDLLAGQ